MAASPSTAANPVEEFALHPTILSPARKSGGAENAPTLPTERPAPCPGCTDARIFALITNESPPRWAPACVWCDRLPDDAVTHAPERYEPHVVGPIRFAVLADELNSAGVQAPGEAARPNEAAAELRERVKRVKTVLPAESLEYDRAGTLTVWRVLANSSFHRDARAIADAAEALRDMAERFLEEHDTTDITKALHAAGLGLDTPDYAEDVAEAILSDVKGLHYNTELSASLLWGEVLRTPEEEFVTAKG